jgi:hypothetical protein
MNKYNWFHDGKGVYRIIHTEGKTNTIIAITDTAEKAHFLATTANFFNAYANDPDKVLRVDKFSGSQMSDQQVKDILKKLN